MMEGAAAEDDITADMIDHGITSTSGKLNPTKINSNNLKLFAGFNPIEINLKDAPLTPSSPFPPLHEEIALKEWIYANYKEEIVASMNIQKRYEDAALDITARTATSSDVDDDDYDSLEDNNEELTYQHHDDSAADDATLDDECHDSEEKEPLSLPQQQQEQELNPIDDDQQMQTELQAQHVKQRPIDLVKKTKLLDTITQVQRLCLTDQEDPRVVFGHLLDSILNLVDSEYGFIGEVLFWENGEDDRDGKEEDTKEDDQGDSNVATDATTTAAATTTAPNVNEENEKKKNPSQPKQGKPYLKAHAYTNIAWDAATRELVAEMDKNGGGLNFLNMHSLFGNVIITGKPVISNSPYTDSRRCGLPSGHPPLNHFLGIPFFESGTSQVIGMVGISNKPGGYSQHDIDFMEPYIITCATLIQAYRAIREKHNLIDTLEQKVIERTKELASVNLRNEQLLRNMLPEETVTRLKAMELSPTCSSQRHQILSDHYDCATVLFADIVGFTSMCSVNSPSEVVQVLNDVFTRFDKLVDRYGLNKVKTVSECSMVCPDQVLVKVRCEYFKKNLTLQFSLQLYILP